MGCFFEGPLKLSNPKKRGFSQNEIQTRTDSKCEDGENPFFGKYKVRGIYGKDECVGT